MLQARDAFGNARTVGGDDVQVTAAKGAAVVQVRGMRRVPQSCTMKAMNRVVLLFVC